MRLPGVVFDMDGLLLDTERVCLDAFVQSRRNYSLPDNPEVFLQCVGLRGEACSKIISESLDNKISLNDFNREWDKRITSALNKNVPVKPGALELLKILKKNGHSLAVATSTRSATATDQLDASQLLKYFDCIVGGEQVSNPKPDPEPYHKAAASIGCEANQCIVFEDSETGVRAAIASGARTVQVPDLIAPSNEVKAMGHLIVSNLIEGAISVGLIEDKDLN